MPIFISFARYIFRIFIPKGPRLKSATHSICVKLLHKHDKLTQCCRAFTLALARLSCWAIERPVHIPTLWWLFEDSWCVVTVVGDTYTVEDWTECTQTHTQTQKWKQYIRQFHSVHLADIIKVFFVNLTKLFTKLRVWRDRYCWAGGGEGRVSVTVSNEHLLH